MIQNAGGIEDEEYDPEIVRMLARSRMAGMI